MSRVVRFHQTGSAEVLPIGDEQVAAPDPLKYMNH